MLDECKIVVKDDPEIQLNREQHDKQTGKERSGEPQGEPLTESQGKCPAEPQEERLTDAYGRTIDYLRISLTDRCNLRCRYCMPEEGILAFRHDEILTLEEVYRVAEVLTGMGIRRIRLTGGEPLVRKNMQSLVRRLGQLPSRPELSLTTNGVLLEEYLEEFHAAGLRSINISLDTKDPETYRKLTGVDALDRVERAIEKAVAMGMRVKLNCVPIRGINEEELADFVGMARELPLDVRFIELMPIGCASEFRGIARDEILSGLEKVYGPAEPVLHDGISNPGKGGISDPGKDGVHSKDEGKNASAEGPAEYIHFRGFLGRVGFISPMSHAFCENCNRVRLTADGRLKLCLYYPDGPALLPMLREGCTDEELRNVIRQGLLLKPERHSFGRVDRPARSPEDRNMNQIGG